MPFPGWDAVEAEKRQGDPKIWLTVRDDAGNVIRRLSGPTKKGFHRISWDLQLASSLVIDVNSKNENFNRGSNTKVGPGKYSVVLSKEIDGSVTELSEAVPFNVVPLQKGTLKGAEPDEVASFWKEIHDFYAELSDTKLVLKNSMKKVKAMELALSSAVGTTSELEEELYQIQQELYTIEEQINGKKTKNEIGEKNTPTLNNRISAASRVVSNSTYGPTETAIRSFEIAKEEHAKIQESLRNISEEQLPVIEKKMLSVGAPEVK